MMSKKEIKIINKIRKHIKDFRMIALAIIPATAIMLLLLKLLEVISSQIHYTDIRLLVELMIVSFSLSIGAILGLKMALKEVKEWKED